MSMLATTNRFSSRQHRAYRPRASAPAAALVNFMPLRTQTAVFENREAITYIAHLAAHCHLVSEAERQAVMAFAQAWAGSADIRAEFGSFSVFASYMRGRRSRTVTGVVR